MSGILSQIRQLDTIADQQQRAKGFTDLVNTLSSKKLIADIKSIIDHGKSLSLFL